MEKDGKSISIGNINMLHVIILAAGTIRKKINFLKYTFDSPALIPVNTKPLASKLIEFYRERLPDARICLAINAEVEGIVRKFLAEYEQIVDFIPILDSVGVNDTLRQAAKVLSLKEEVIVNLVSTIPTELADCGQVLVDSKISSSDEWSSISVSNETRIFNYKEANNNEDGNAFTGVFRTKVGLLLNALGQLNDDELGDLLRVVEHLHDKAELEVRKTEWIDCGHEMNYYKAKTKLISSRAFNKIEVDSVKSTLTKRSLQHKTQTNEIEFILGLPESLRIYFPRVLQEPKRKGDITEVKMEYYGYPSLAEYMLFWNINSGLWQNIFNALIRVMEEFQTYSSNINLNAFLEFYWGKTEKRLADFKDQLGDEDNIFQDTIMINEVEYSNIQLYKRHIVDRLTSMHNKTTFNIMHGDLCFNNILYDLYSGTIRLIDARGSFGRNVPGIYGDQCYDIAKIAHSSIGKYDYIVNGMFALSENQHSYKYAIFECANHHTIIEKTTNLVEHFAYDLDDILFLVSLLFVSMTPLHNDSVRRQKVFYLHGLKLLNDSLGGPIL